MIGVGTGVENVAGGAGCDGLDRCLETFKCLVRSFCAGIRSVSF